MFQLDRQTVVSDSLKGTGASKLPACSPPLTTFPHCKLSPAYQRFGCGFLRRRTWSQLSSYHLATCCGWSSWPTPTSHLPTSVDVLWPTPLDDDYKTTTTFSSSKRPSKKWTSSRGVTNHGGLQGLGLPHMRAVEIAPPFRTVRNQSGASSSSHVRGHLPTAEGERAYGKADN